MPLLLGRCSPHQGIQLGEWSLRRSSAFSNLALLGINTTYITVHVTLRPEAESPALRDSPMPKVPYHPNRQHCGCGGTTIPGFKSGSGATNVAAAPSRGPSQLSTRMKKLIWPGVTMGNTTTGESQESSSRTLVPLPPGFGKMMSPLPDLPPMSMRFPTAPKFTSLLETVPMLFPECPEAHATGLFHHQWANLFSSISEQNMLNLASGT